MSRKVIITCAVTGAIHTPSMSKALPVTPQEIADAAIGAAEAGAAIVHLHARNPKTGQPDQSPEAFAPFLKVIKQRSNCVINLTTAAPIASAILGLTEAGELQLTLSDGTFAILNVRRASDNEIGKMVTAWTLTMSRILLGKIANTKKLSAWLILTSSSLILVACFLPLTWSSLRLCWADLTENSISRRIGFAKHSSPGAVLL